MAGGQRNSAFRIDFCTGSITGFWDVTDGLAVTSPTLVETSSLPLTAIVGANLATQYLVVATKDILHEAAGPTFVYRLRCSWWVEHLCLIARGP